MVDTCMAEMICLREVCQTQFLSPAASVTRCSSGFSGLTVLHDFIHAQLAYLLHLSVVFPEMEDSLRIANVGAGIG